MIIRSWRAVAASQEDVDTYRAHIEHTTFKEMALPPGHIGAFLTKKKLDKSHILLAMSYCEDLASVEAIAKGTLHKAIVKPFTRDLLESFDEEVEYFEVLASSMPFLKKI